MFVDLHMHERTFSKDSFLTLKEIVEIAKEKGLDGVCITDHDDIGIKEYAEQYSRAVSYTHLDVYKRQWLRRELSLARRQSKALVHRLMR